MRIWIAGLFLFLAGCPAPVTPSTLNEGIAYGDALAAGIEKTLGAISCPHQLNGAKQCLDATSKLPVPNAILDPRDALNYSGKLTTIHSALKALPAMPAGGGSCVPGLPATVGTPALPAQSAPTPGACLVIISGLLTSLQTELTAMGSK